jgi:hypothetical protein
MTESVNPSNPINLESIYYAYKELFPNEFEFLVLYHLYSNYHSSEMQYVEIKQAIADTSRLPYINTGKERQVERTFKSLLRTFIERAPSKFTRFILTPHAEKIVEIATQRIRNPYLKFPLKDTFETYFSLPENAIHDINELERWFKFGFQNNARQAVLGHLDSLKISVDDSVKALNKILEADNISAMQMLEQFSQNFQILGDKARQITEAIKMKVDVHYRLRDLVASFSYNPLAATNKESDYGIWQYNLQTAFRIKEEVEIFFEKVDIQLDVINMKMAFAGAKIAELQESLRTKSRYKISLKKLLLYLLENSKMDIKGIHLPKKFPAKGLVLQKFRFRGIRYYDMGFLRRAKPFEQETDAAYEESQRNQFEQELQKQVLIQQHCDDISNALSVDKYIDLNKKLFEIMQLEDGLELGIQTSYEFIRNLPSEYHIQIEEKLTNNQSNDIHLWKTTIHSNRDSNS